MVMFVGDGAMFVGEPGLLFRGIELLAITLAVLLGWWIVRSSHREETP